jgi:phage shock protein C
VAEYLGVNADVVRAVWVLSVLIGGLGVLPYVAALLLVPEGEVESEPQRRDQLPRFLGLALIFLAGFVLFRQFGIGIFAWWSWRLFIPLLLLAGGVLLVWPQTRERIGFGPDRKLTRSVSNRVLAGVAGGIADTMSIDANLVRIALVLLTGMTAGIAAILYLVLMLLLPEERIEAPAPPITPAPVVPPPAPAPSPTPSPPAEPPPAEPAAGSEESSPASAAGEPPPGVEEPYPESTEGESAPTVEEPPPSGEEAAPSGSPAADDVEAARERLRSEYSKGPSPDQENPGPDR